MATNDTQTSPDYPFTTGPRDWYDGGELDDTACTACGASLGGGEGWDGLCWQCAGVHVAYYVDTHTTDGDDGPCD